MPMSLTCKKKLSLVQVNFQQGPTECNSFALPYAVGCLWAYAEAQSDIKDFWQLDHVIWRRGDVEITAQLLCKQDLVGFSTYVWNRNWNNGVAKRIKELNPQCKIVYGGPEPAITRPDYFEKNPWVDVVIKNEGEITFASLLKSYTNIHTVPGLLVNCKGVPIDTGPAVRIDDLDCLPSPYLTGFFDQLIQDNPDVEWTTAMETTRGCPYQCTFCDWGSLTYSKVKKFSMDRIFDELAWMSRNRIAYLSLADANFGIFPERDTAIATRFVELQNEFDFPYGFNTSWAKNATKDVINIIEILIKKSKFFNSGLMLSLQTLDENVLEIIRRRNLKLNKLEDMLDMARVKNIPVSTELILGLPGETLKSWKRTIWGLLELNMHDNIDIFYSQLLENAEMNLVQKQIYQIETTTIHDYFAASSGDNNGSYAESIEVTKSTIDMPFEDLIDASLFSWFMFTWHLGGLSDMASRFIRRYRNISYEEFYSKLLETLDQQSWYGDLRRQHHDLLLNWFSNGKVTIDNQLGLKIDGFNIMFYIRQLLHARRELLEPWYATLQCYLEQYDIPQDLLAELMQLQRLQMVDMRSRDQYPIKQKFNHNLWQYIVHNEPLVQEPQVIEFTFPEKIMGDQEYLERLYWNRRRRFGKTWINDSKHS